MRKTINNFYDIDDIKKLVSDALNKSKLAHDVSGLKTGVSNLNDQISELTGKSDTLDKKLDRIYTVLDGFAGEVKTYREQQELNSKKLSDHTDELEKLDKRVKRVEQPAL